MTSSPRTSTAPTGTSLAARASSAAACASAINRRSRSETTGGTGKSAGVIATLISGAAAAPKSVTDVSATSAVTVPMGGTGLFNASPPSTDIEPDRAKQVDESLTANP